MKTRKSIKLLRKSTDTSNSDEDMSLHDDSDDSLKSTQSKFGKNVVPAKQKSAKELCVVCQKEYDKSIEDWYQCKLCSKWAHESCGQKGHLNFFCNLCF